MDTSERLLTLLSLLQARPDWTGPELAERLGVTGRTVRNDVERLRRLGYPVHASPGVGGGYRLGAGAALPPLLLDDEEAVAVAVGLRTAAGGAVAGIEETSLRALVKLEQVLPAHLRRRVGALGSATISLPVGGPTVDPQHLTVIAAACRDSECLRFGYRRRDGTKGRREVEPDSLVNHGRRWYLAAWDRRRDDWRTFRVDRMAKPASTGVRFTPAPVAGEGCGRVRQTEHHHGAEPIRGRGHPARCRGEGREPRPRLLGSDRADRRAHLHVPDRRRRPQMAGAAHRDGWS